MTTEFSYLTRALSTCAVGAPPPQKPAAVAWADILALAKAQEVQTLLVPALLALPDMPLLSEPLRVYRRMVAWNAARAAVLFPMLRELRAAGVRALLLKGDSLAQLYHVPESRISADVDVYVGKDGEAAAVEFFRSRGFAVKPRAGVGCHATAKRRDVGAVELHVVLLEEYVDDLWFAGRSDRTLLSEKPRAQTSEFGEYETLGGTDGFLYLAMHLAKHFVGSGMSLRQMLDLTLYYAKHEELLDRARLWDELCVRKLETLVSTVLRATISACALPETWLDRIPGERNPAAEAALLADLERRGYLGRALGTDAVRDAQSFTDAAGRAKKGGAGYFFYRAQTRLRSLKETFFPSAERLRAAGCASNLCGRVRFFNETVRGYFLRKKNEAGKPGDRMALFQMLDMLQRNRRTNR